VGIFCAGTGSFTVLPPNVNGDNIVALSQSCQLFLKSIRNKILPFVQSFMFYVTCIMLLDKRAEVSSQLFHTIKCNALKVVLFTHFCPFISMYLISKYEQILVIMFKGIVSRDFEDAF
jgi:hypothetical protein